MDLIYLLGLFVALYYLAVVILVFIADSDLITYWATKYGRDPEKHFKGKVAWVTGASSGIGEAISKELAKYGAKVILSARRESELERVQAECLKLNTNLNKSDILVLPFDMVNYDAHEKAMKQVIDTFGRLDLFIGNAGIPQLGYWHEVERKVDDQVFQLNTFSMVNLSRLVVKRFLEQGGGQFGIVSSMAGVSASAFSATYSASKSALHGYFNTLRLESVGKNIDVSIICPGPVETPIFNKAVSSNGGVTQFKLPGDLTIMTPERCAYLTLVALTNKINESWVSPVPILPLMYLPRYFPVFYENVFFPLIGKRMVSHFKETLQLD